MYVLCFLMYLKFTLQQNPIEGLHLCQTTLLLTWLTLHSQRCMMSGRVQG